MDPATTPTELAHDWQRAGVRSGDMLLLHSSIQRLARRHLKKGVRLSAEDVIQSFILALGVEGTLLLPTFNFDFTSGKAFDIRNSPSQMGPLSEAGRTWRGAVRTAHPVYSFVAIGGRADEFRHIENDSAYGNDSPFGILHRTNGRIAVLDLPDQRSMTFYHYVEESLSVPYRYHKRFTAPFIGMNSQSRPHSCSVFVRDVERGVVTDVERMGEHLWAAGLYQGERSGTGSGLRTISAAALFEATAEVIRQGRAEGMLYRVDPPA